MSEKEFPEGFFFNEPHQNAPDFVLGSVSISKEKFLGWLEGQQSNSKGYVRLAIKRSKEGKVYCEVDNWEPGNSPQKESRPQEDDEFDDEIPF